MGTALFTDGEAANAALFNQTLALGAATAGVFMWFGRVKYNGTTWEVDAAHSSAGITTGALAWDGGASELGITLTSFASVPIVLATPAPVDTNYTVKAYGESITQAVLRFYAISGGALITTEDTLMDVNVQVIGNYVS